MLAGGALVMGLAKRWLISQQAIAAPAATPAFTAVQSAPPPVQSGRRYRKPKAGNRELQNRQAGAWQTCVALAEEAIAGYYTLVAAQVEYKDASERVTKGSCPSSGVNHAALLGAIQAAESREFARLRITRRRPGDHVVVARGREDKTQSECRNGALLPGQAAVEPAGPGSGVRCNSEP
jgi:hypothetical protein